MPIQSDNETITRDFNLELNINDGDKQVDDVEVIKVDIQNDSVPVSPAVTCLHCFSDNSTEQIFELPVTDSEEASGWEIGRDLNCDIVIENSSVSNRHAQIIHQKGRWKIVNLVSTNGIVINGQKKLSAYLDDGDKIGLGSVDLIFKTPKNNNKPPSTNKNFIVPVVMGLVLIGLAIGIYLNLEIFA